MNGRRGYRIEHEDGEESFVPTLTGLNVLTPPQPVKRPAREMREPRRPASSEAFKLLVLSLVLVFLAVLGGHALALIQKSCGV